MESACVSRNERVGRDRKTGRWRQAQLDRFFRTDPKGAALRQAVALGEHVYTLALLPRPPLCRQQVRPGNISQRPFILADIGQEQPGLESWVECIGMKLDLWIRFSFGVAGADRLDVVERFAAITADIGHHALPKGAMQQRGKVWMCSKQRWPDRNSPRHRIPLPMLSAFEFRLKDCGLEPAENIVREEVWNNDETVAVELLPKLLRNQAGEPGTPPPGKPMGSSHPPQMKPRPVQAPRTQHRVVHKTFRSREEGERPKWESPPTGDVASQPNQQMLQ